MQQFSEENPMFKNRKILIISVLAAAVILSMGLIGGVVYAASGTSTDSNSSSDSNPHSVLMEKVAKILGLDTSTVESAFTQAQKEMKAEALDNRLQKLVDDGKITQEQAAEYKSWLESKPDVNVPGLGDGMEMGGPRGMRGMGGMERHGMGAPPSTDTGDSSSTDE
jgi:hypothetical protein